MIADTAGVERMPSLQKVWPIFNKTGLTCSATLAYSNHEPEMLKIRYTAHLPQYGSISSGISMFAVDHFVP
jgi:hypothetical protein